MRVRRIVAAVLTAAVLGTVYVSGVVAQEGGGRGRGTHILGKAPTDQAVPLPKSKLDQYLKDMDAAKEETLRIIEGGQFNVNIRRIKKPEAAPLIHPKTIDVWYVMEGSGAVTTGGTFADGKVTGGVTDRLQPRRRHFHPGQSSALAERDGRRMASPGSTFVGTSIGRGRWAPAIRRCRASRAAPRVGEYAPPDKAVFLPKAKLEAYIAEQNSRESTSQTMRMIEGGHFNVNIRNITAPSIEFHPTTIDTWVVLQGAGTAATGFSTDKGDAHTEATGRDAKRIANTGVETPMAVGDVMFVPSNFTHGFSEVDGRMVWLNIRWDSNY